MTARVDTVRYAETSSDPRTPMRPLLTFAVITTAAAAATCARRARCHDALTHELTALAWRETGIWLTPVEQGAMRRAGFFKPFVVDPAGDGLSLAVLHFQPGRDGPRVRVQHVL